MEYLIKDDESTVDLSKYSIKDSCLWLLNRLQVDKYQDNPYTLPFCSYVITWHRTIPLTCIVMAQNPYPNNIYPPISAAMSYSTDLCITEMKKGKFRVPIPPTVEIFANDLYINANMKKEDTIDILKNGWALVDYGILLVNEGVFTLSDNPEYYKESSNQCNVIIRLLRETEQYGKRTVDVYGLGEAGQRMASNLCSWYKSDTVKLSKHTATHPAALSRRFTNFNHPECHMGVPSFSKSLAKHFSNHVAFLHTMAKKSDVDIRIQRYADIIRTAGEQFSLHEQAQKDFNETVREVLNMNPDDRERFNETFNKLLNAGETLAFRIGLTSSAISNIQRMGESVSSHVSKSGPSLVNPSGPSLAQHIGQQTNSTVPIPVKSVKLNLSKKRPSLPATENSSFANVSPPASVKSVQSTISTPTKLKLGKSSLSTNSTPVKSTEPQSTSKSTSKSTVSSPTNDIVENEGPRAKSSLGAHFRKMNLIANSKKLESFGKQKKEDLIDAQYRLTVDQKNQLSSVEAVVQAHKEDALDDKECTDLFEQIQDDISSMRKYNTVVYRLTEAIDEDLKNNPKFDFANWVIDTKEHSVTFDVCREIFEF